MHTVKTCPKKYLITRSRYEYMGQKIVVIALSVCFLMMAMPPSDGISEHHVTFAKYMPDGRIETFSMKIELGHNESVSEGISRVCAQLLLSDNELQSYADQGFGLYMIASSGSGFHFTFPQAFSGHPILTSFTLYFPQ